MGRCGGWMKILALLLAAFTASCGDTGGGPSGSGKPFVFEARGRLNLISQLKIEEPTVLTLVATLLDPQGNPFRNQRVTFEAEFPDATIVPANTLQNVPLACLPPGSNGNATRCTNRGAAITDDLGQAQVTVIAGLTLGRMRITAEAPANLNISSAISVNITNQGFLTGGTLTIIPSAVTFLNPLVRPGEDGPMTIFSAFGGTPPYRWDNVNKEFGRIEPQGIPNINEKAKYTLIGPSPINTTDTIILLDAAGGRAEATVRAIFAECTLTFSASSFDIDPARAGDFVQIQITNGVPFSPPLPPYIVTQEVPRAGQVTFDPNDPNRLIYTVADPPASATDRVLIRDSRGCIGTFTVTITPASVKTLTLTSVPATVPNSGGAVDITAFAFDIDNQPLKNVTIVFRTSRGTIDPVSDVTDVDGKATTKLTIPGTTDTAASTVTVTATADNGVNTSVAIEVQAAPPPP